MQVYSGPYWYYCEFQRTVNPLRSDQRQVLFPFGDNYISRWLTHHFTAFVGFFVVKIQAGNIAAGIPTF